jgi:hypothetical protein
MEVSNLPSANSNSSSFCEITAGLEFRRWLVDCIETSDGKQEGSERRNVRQRVSCNMSPVVHRRPGAFLLLARVEPHADSCSNLYLSAPDNLLFLDEGHIAAGTLKILRVSL